MLQNKCAEHYETIVTTTIKRIMMCSINCDQTINFVSAKYLQKIKLPCSVMTRSNHKIAIVICEHTSGSSNVGAVRLLWQYFQEEQDIIFLHGQIFSTSDDDFCGCILVGCRGWLVDCVLASCLHIIIIILNTLKGSPGFPNWKKKGDGCNSCLNKV